MLADWQNKNCKGCRFADKKKVGTGEACCTYFEQIKADSKGNCLSYNGENNEGIYKKGYAKNNHS